MKYCLFRALDVIVSAQQFQAHCRNDRHFPREQWINCSFRYKEVSIMVEFWTRLHQPDAILMLFVAALCLAVHAYPGYSGYRKSRKGFWWVLYVIVCILALIEWIILVFL